MLLKRPAQDIDLEGVKRGQCVYQDLLICTEALAVSSDAGRDEVSSPSSLFEFDQRRTVGCSPASSSLAEQVAELAPAHLGRPNRLEVRLAEAARHIPVVRRIAEAVLAEERVAGVEAGPHRTAEEERHMAAAEVALHSRSAVAHHTTAAGVEVHPTHPAEEALPIVVVAVAVVRRTDLAVRHTAREGVHPTVVAAVAAARPRILVAAGRTLRR